MSCISSLWSEYSDSLANLAVVGLVTEYYTGGSPVEKIAKDGETGSATVLISGLATGMQSVAIPVLTIVLIIFISNINSIFNQYCC